MTTLLSYAIREDNAPSKSLPPLALKSPNPEEHGSVDDKLVARMSYDYSLFKDKNARVQYFLDDAEQVTQRTASTKHCQRKNNDRGSWLLLFRKHTEKDK